METQESTRHLSAEKILEFYQKTQQVHLIPEFSRSKQDIVRHIQVYLLDSPNNELSLLHKSGQKYQVIESEALDSIFALVDTQNQDPALTEKQLTKLVTMALESSLGIETMDYVVDFARKKQVQILTDDLKLTSDQGRAIYSRSQNRFELVKQLKDMLAVVTFLEENTIESNELIYDGMTLKILAENAYEELLSIAREATSVESIKPMPLKVKEKIGTLLNTKEMNPALFFSISFKFGVYLPILAPFVVPIILTVTLVIRGKLFRLICNKKKDEKVKTD